MEYFQELAYKDGTLRNSGSIHFNKDKDIRYDFGRYIYNSNHLTTSLYGNGRLLETIIVGADYIEQLVLIIEYN